MRLQEQRREQDRNGALEAAHRRKHGLAVRAPQRAQDRVDDQRAHDGHERHGHQRRIDQRMAQRHLGERHAEHHEHRDLGQRLRVARRTSAPRRPAEGRRHRRARGRTGTPRRSRCRARVRRARTSRTPPASTASGGAIASVGQRGPSTRAERKPAASPTTAPSTPRAAVVHTTDPPSIPPLPAPADERGVSAMATGSLNPASASSSRTTRTPPAPARETAANTAAGSVGESTAPSRSASRPGETDERMRGDRDEAERGGRARDAQRENGAIARAPRASPQT